MRLAVLLVVTACKVTGTFTCERAEQCQHGDTPGFCDDGFCSFFDATCPGGHRYSDNAAGDLSGHCTPCTTFSVTDDTCTFTPSAEALVLSGMNSYNTDTHVLTTPGGDQPLTRVSHGLDLVLVGSFTLEANAVLRVDGSLGFGIVAFDSIQIDGSIDLSAGGAGSRACGPASGKTPNNDAEGGPGGGGGALGGAGGAGGDGDTDLTRTAGGAGGTATARPGMVLGGCPGGAGGMGGGTGGIGGAGGGAIYLVADTSIKISATGVINVGGGGGRRGSALGVGGGGGGGGSGGMIVIDSPIVQTMGFLVANGGGGGGGGGGTDGQPGGTLPATGGLPGTGGSAGANGGTTGNGATAADSTASAGGGGGGCGFIAIASPALLASGTITPPQQPWP